MKSLDIMSYINIIQESEKQVTRSQIETADWMRRWDEVRTSLNPDAKWYDEREANNEKDIINTNNGDVTD